MALGKYCCMGTWTPWGSLGHHGPCYTLTEPQGRTQNSSCSKFGAADSGVEGVMVLPMES